MRFIFHDFTRHQPHLQPTGKETLTISGAGKFDLSAALVDRLKLAIGQTVCLLQDMDSEAWFFYVGPYGGRKLFVLSRRRKGGGLGWYSTSLARTLLKYYPPAAGAKSLTVPIGPLVELPDSPLPGRLYQLELPPLGSHPAPADPAAAPAGGTPELPAPEPGAPAETTTASEPVGEEPALPPVEPEPVSEPAPLAPVIGQSEWPANGDEVLRRLFSTATSEEIATELGVTGALVRRRAKQLDLKKRPPAKPKAANEESIGAGLQARLMKWVDKLGTKSVQRMDEHDARQALKLLHEHRTKLDHVPGGARLLERLAAYYSLPV